MLAAMKLRTLPCLLIGALLVGCGGSPEPESRVDPEPSAGGEATMSFEDALAAGRAQMPDGMPIEVEVEMVDGTRYLEVEMIEGDGITEMYFDPSNGELFRSGPEAMEEDEAAAFPSLRAALEARPRAMEEALERALATHDAANVREVSLVWAEDALAVRVVTEDGGAAQTQQMPLDPVEQAADAPAPETQPSSDGVEEELIE